VLGDMFNTVFRPNKPPNLHVIIVTMYCGLPNTMDRSYLLLLDEAGTDE
jgi:hypothetical protein